MADYLSDRMLSLRFAIRETLFEAAITTACPGMLLAGIQYTGSLKEAFPKRIPLAKPSLRDGGGGQQWYS